MFSKADGTPPDAQSEHFVYAENEKNPKGVFTFLCRGPKVLFHTHFLDRAKYKFDEMLMEYEKVFETGVVVGLWRGGSLFNPVPAIASSEYKKEWFRAFSGADWQYPPKDASDESGTASILSTRPEAIVSSWITQLPQPDKMLPHSEASQVPVDEVGEKPALPVSPRLAPAPPPRKVNDHAPPQPRPSSQAISHSNGWVPPHLRHLRTAVQEDVTKKVPPPLPRPFPGSIPPHLKHLHTPTFLILPIRYLPPHLWHLKPS